MTLKTFRLYFFYAHGIRETKEKHKDTTRFKYSDLNYIILSIQFLRPWK